MDGKKFYMLKTSADKWHDATRDQHNFIMRSSSRVGFQGIRKVGFCHGSLVCPNPKCCFLSTSHQSQPNRFNWKTSRGKKDTICHICDILQQQKGVLPESLWSICHLKKQPIYIILGIISVI